MSRRGTQTDEAPTGERPDRGTHAANPLRARAQHALKTKVFRDTSWTMLAEMAGMASQLITLVLITRAFDSKETFGLFSGTVAFMNVISPFTTIGMGYVLLQRLAGEGGNPDVESGKAWTMVVLGGLAGMLVAVAVSSVLLPGVPLVVVVCLAFGELVFTQIAYTGKFLAQGLDKPANGARVVATVWALRLLAAIVYLNISPSPTLTAWAIAHMTASLVGAVLTIVALQRLLAISPRPGLATRHDIRRGLGYSLTIGAGYVKNDADKTLLVSFEKAEAAALYSLAYKVITPLFVPVRALAESTFARFFREAAHAPQDAYRLARRTTIIGAGMAFGGGAVLALCAPLLPWLLGDRWEPAVVVTQLLAFVPVLIAAQMYAFNALIGLGRQKACLIITVSASLLNIVLNVVLIPSHDWKGSLAATFVAEALSVVALWTLLRRQTSPRADAATTLTNASGSER